MVTARQYYDLARRSQDLSRPDTRQGRHRRRPPQKSMGSTAVWPCVCCDLSVCCLFNLSASVAVKVWIIGWRLTQVSVRTVRRTVTISQGGHKISADLTHDRGDTIGDHHKCGVRRLCECLVLKIPCIALC